jgi:hypothetical protein
MGAVLTNISNFKAFTGLTVVRLRENSLTTTSVNNILIDLDNNDQLNGNCRLNGGTNAAPDGAGITAKNNLLSKGWTANTN